MPTRPAGWKTTTERPIAFLTASAAGRSASSGYRRGPRPRIQNEVSRSEFGSLAIRVQPGDVSITIDGEPWENTGQNERLIVQLGPGVHNVQIRRDGYRTYMTDVTVRPGETTTLNVAMTPNK